MAEACLESWTRQTCARERLQLVVVDHGVGEWRAARLRAYLGQRDVWVESDDQTESVLYDRGTRAAQAAVVLFTEAHCVARVGAVERVLECFRDDAVAAAVVASGHLPSDNQLAQMQAALESELVKVWPPGHPRTISLRGFAVRRDAYLALGGFQRAHGRFCETALGIAIARSGRRIERTAEAVIDHANCTSVSDLAAALAGCGRGQLAWREEMDVESPGLADEWLGPLLIWRQRPTLMPESSRALLHVTVASLLFDVGRRGFMAKARATLRRVPLLLAGSWLRGRGLRLIARVLLMTSTVRWWMSRLSGVALPESYRRLWESSFELGFFDYVSRNPLVPQWPEITASERSIAEFPEGALAGFHAREHGSDGSPIRWSSSAALLRLGFAPGDYTLHVAWHAPKFGDEWCLDVFFNGRRVAARADARSLEVRISRETCQSDGRQELAFTGRAFRAGIDDQRLLGAAVLGIALQH